MDLIDPPDIFRCGLALVGLAGERRVRLCRLDIHCAVIADIDQAPRRNFADQWRRRNSLSDNDLTLFGRWC